eukprot:6938470-Pyramimonas_sp.AAC.2
MSRARTRGGAGAPCTAGAGAVAVLISATGPRNIKSSSKLASKAALLPLTTMRPCRLFTSCIVSFSNGPVLQVTSTAG